MRTTQHVTLAVSQSKTSAINIATLFVFLFAVHIIVDCAIEDIRCSVATSDDVTSTELLSHIKIFIQWHLIACPRISIVF